ncbi:hypothetical protein SAMN05444920_1344 [Nonomuraea solani]|uniref:Uncharacterized protein n=1 Tax=Nonomuraea solani TaxID=1144553 RepID=A0A1H6EZ79_9ACTN|nr:hypothetical protein [Nonomuraea solani]SEH03200.1 hypothetical protein SAMN05444920_1344 [Nonomuraea solani]
MAGFGLIVSLWWLTLHYGLSAVAGAPERGLRPYVALPVHFAMTARARRDRRRSSIRMVASAGRAVYFAASTALEVALKAGRRWI